MDELNKKLDDSFLNGIVIERDVETNIEVFDKSIDQQDDMTDEWKESLEKEADKSEINVAAYKKTVLNNILLFGIIILLISNIIGISIFRKIIKSIHYISKIVTQITDGDLNIDLETNYKNEIDELVTLMR